MCIQAMGQPQQYAEKRHQEENRAYDPSLQITDPKRASAICNNGIRLLFFMPRGERSERKEEELMIFFSFACTWITL